MVEEKKEDEFAKYLNNLKCFAADFLLFRGEIVKGSEGAVPEEQIAFLFDSFKKDQRTDAINTRGDKNGPATASTAQISYIRSLYAKKDGGEDKVGGFLKSLEKPALAEQNEKGEDIKILLTSGEASQLITELKELPDKPRRTPYNRGY